MGNISLGWVWGWVAAAGCLFVGGFVGSDGVLLFGLGGCLLVGFLWVFVLLGKQHF